MPQGELRRGRRPVVKRQPEYKIKCFRISATIENKQLQQISKRRNMKPACLVQDITCIQSSEIGAKCLSQILPRPTTRPLTAAAIGAITPSASAGLDEFGKSDSMLAGVGGGDKESNLNAVGTPNSPGGTTVTMILASSCLHIFNCCRCWSRNISSRLPGAVCCDAACNSHPGAPAALRLT